MNLLAGIENGPQICLLRSTVVQTGSLIALVGLTMFHSLAAAS